MTRNLEFSLLEYYHLFDRGCDKRTIFEQEPDYWRFLKLLYLCNDVKSKVDMRNYKSLTRREIFSIKRNDPLVAIGTYNLMPNHIHINSKEIVENGISLFIQKVKTGYTSYFNNLNDRTGALFGSTFKAKHVNNDPYLKYLYSYIHLNPLVIHQSDWKINGINNQKEAKDFLKNYEFSSYIDYLLPEGNRIQKNILTPEEFPDYFSENNSFERNVQDFLDYED